MKKIKIREFRRYRIIVKARETKVILDYLNGEMSARALAIELKYSPQGVINFVAQICRQWYQEGKLKYYKKGWKLKKINKIND